MEHTAAAYTGYGCHSMDKAATAYYTSEGNELTIESVFVGNEPIKDVLKQYIFDRLHGIELASTECYTDSSNMIAVVSKEDCQ